MKSPSSVNRRAFLRQASLGVGAGLALPDLFLNKTKEYRAPWKLPRV